MRPVSIVWFERVYAVAIVIGAVRGVIVGQLLGAVTGLSLAVRYLGVGIGVAIPILLLWLIARRRSDPARWVLVALTALSVAGQILSTVRGTTGFGAWDLGGLVHLLLTVVAVVLTFRPDARAWLVRRRPEA